MPRFGTELLRFLAISGLMLGIGYTGERLAEGADWPQYRGPGLEGASAESGLLEAWDESQPRVVWQRPIGAGYSSVTAVGDRLYTMDTDEVQEHVVCLSAATGETMWSVDVGAFVQAELGDGGPRATPSVIDGVVYAATSQSRLLALAATDGSVLWQHDLTEMGPPPRFGYSSSPVVDGELVVLEVGAENQSPGIVALDRKTGERLWASLEGPAGYSTALPIEVDGIRQYVLFRRANQEAVGLATTGEVLWRFPTPDALASIVMPVFVAPDRLFFSTSDDKFGGHMIRLVHDRGVFAAEEVWSERLMRNHFNTSVLVGEHLYGFDNGTLRCLDARTGERMWAKRGFGKGSLIAAEDRLYVLSDGGLIAMVQATAAGYEELGRAQVTRGRSWTAPSLADGRLYWRDFDEIVSLDIRGDTTDGEGAP